MDGSPVCRALRELGYEGALRREAFDWLASMPNARVRGVVEWLASLGPDCSVVRQMTPVQRKTYQELQARGHVLRGEGLREAWERLTSASALLSADELRAELERARQDVSELERRLKKSVQRRNAVMRAKGGEQERATLEVRVRRQEAHQELDRAHAGADSAVDRLEEEMVALTTRCDAAVQSFTASNASEHLHARLVTSGHARYDAADQKGLHALAAFVDRQFDAVRGPMRRLQADEGLRAVDGDPATLPATPQPALLAERGSEGAAEQQGGPSAASYQLQRCHRLLRAVRGVAARAAEAGASARALRARAEAATTLCAQRRRRLAELSLLDDVTVKCVPSLLRPSMWAPDSPSPFPPLFDRAGSTLGTRRRRQRRRSGVRLLPLTECKPWLGSGGRQREGMCLWETTRANAPGSSATCRGKPPSCASWRSSRPATASCWQPTLQSSTHSHRRSTRAPPPRGPCTPSRQARTPARGAPLR